MRRSWLAAATFAVGIAGASTDARAGDAPGEPVRILVAAGHRFGLPAEHPLKYANADATRVKEVLVGFGGVRPEHAFVLGEPSRAQLFAAIDRAREAAKVKRADEVTLVFYFSGHGDREAIHLGEERVLLSELTAKLAEVPAGLRIAVTDACRTTREKGFVSDEPFAISSMRGGEASGQVWLHASREGESAQESDDLAGAIFTHAWLNGLRGAADTNGDSRVTLDESFTFAHAQTLIRSAKSSGVLQKPEAVVNLREFAPVVLTQTTKNVATLSLPAARDTHFLVYAAGGKSVLAELWAAPDRRIALALPGGRYSVQRRSGGAGAFAQVAVAAGEERKLEERDFAYGALAPVAQKGERADELEERTANAPPRPHEIAAGYEVLGDTRAGLTQGPRAGYTYSFGRVAVGIGGGASFSARTADTTRTRETLTLGYGRAGVDARFPVGALELHVGGGARAGWLSQTLERPTPAAAARESNGAFTVGPELKASLRARLGTQFFVDVGGVGHVLFLREEGETRGVTSAGGSASLGGQL